MTPRRQSIGLLEGTLYAGLPLLLVSILSARQLGPVFSGVLHNPDSYMRLARLRESLRLGEQVHEMTRDGSGLGTVIHWSHLIDSMLCLLALPFSILAPDDVALHFSAAVFGPLNLAALGLAIAWAAAPFCDRRWLWLGPLAVCLGPAILLYGLVGVAHHHVACVTVAVMCCGWAARAVAGIAPRHAGWALGAWAGVGVWLTPETLPLSVMAFGAMWLAWIRQPRCATLARMIGHAGQALLVTTWLAWLIDPPFGGHTAEDIDRVSIVFVALAAAIAATGLVIRALDGVVRHPIHRMTSSALGGALFAAIWIALFPTALFGSPDIGRDEMSRILFRDISEMAPVDTVTEWLNYLFTGCLGVIALAVLALRTRLLVLFYAVLCGALLVFLGHLHVRFASYPEAIGAVMLPIVVSLWGERVAAWPAWRQPLPRMGTIILFVLVPFAADVLPPAKAARAAGPTTASNCPAAGLSSMLAPYAGEVVLTDINRSPELQYRSGIVTVGSLYHRNPVAFMRLRAAWRSQATDAAPTEFAVARISYVLFCHVPERSALVRDLPETTLLDRLSRGETPPWLRVVAVDPASGHVLFRVGS